MLDKPHMTAPAGRLKAHMGAELSPGLRKALRRQERIIGGIDHQRRHPHISHAPQCRALCPVIPGIAETVQWCRVAVIKLMKTADRVKPGNIDELMSMSDIDGVLVGGASLDAESFARIANYQVA